MMRHSDKVILKILAVPKRKINTKDEEMNLGMYVCMDARVCLSICQTKQNTASLWTEWGKGTWWGWGAKGTERSQFSLYKAMTENIKYAFQILPQRYPSP